MAKKRPSLKNYLSTGEVFAGEESLPAHGETAGKAVSGTEADPAAFSETAPEESKKATAKKKAAPSKKKAPAAPGKKPAGEKKTPVPRSLKKNTPPAPEKPSEEKGEEAHSGGTDSLLEMLAPEDRALWGNLFGAAETEFLPLDLVERRGDFRTMPRDRFTLFRLEEPGKPLHHVRTSVQIREPLVCLIKWDETGRIFVFR